jgi:chromosome segregation ATPase
MIAAIKSIPHRLHHCFANWQSNVTLAGAALAVAGCASAIFSGAPFFAICFAFLTGVCLFCAVRLQELGTLKALAERLSQTERTLNTNVARLENEIGALHTEIELSNAQRSQMSLQIAAYERTFEQNKVLLAELHHAIKTDFGKENQAFTAHNENLKRLAARIETANEELVIKAKFFFEVLKTEQKTQIEELKKLLQDLNDPQYKAEKLQELHHLQEQVGQLKGAIKTHEDPLKELEEKLKRLHAELDRFSLQNDRYAENNDRLSKVTGNIKKESIEKKEFFPINSEERKIAS